MRARLNFFGIGTLIVFFLSQNSVYSQNKKFYITDKGILQYNDLVKTGEDFSKTIKKRGVMQFSHDQQFLIVSPRLEEFRVSSDKKIIADMVSKLLPRIDKAISTGQNEIEFHLIEYMPKFSNYVDKEYQNAADRFGRCAYKAIGQIIDRYSYRFSIKCTAVIGSNGTKVFSENINSWKHYINEAIFFDGRAMLEKVHQAILQIGAEHVQIYNTLGDAFSNPLRLTIANHDDVRSLQYLFPGMEKLTIGLITPLKKETAYFPGHLFGMDFDLKENLKIQYWQENRLTKALKTSSSTIYNGRINNRTEPGGVLMEMQIDSSSFSKKK